MNSNKKYIIPFVVAAIAALALFIVGSFLDKSISEPLYNAYQLNIPWFSIVIVILGPIITNAFGAYGSISLLLVKFSTKRKLNILVRLIGIAGLIGIGFFAYISCLEFPEVIPGLDQGTAKLINILILVFFVLFDVAMFFFTRWFNKDLENKKVFWVALTIVFVIIVTAVTTEIIKYLACRPRPRLIFISGATEEYKNWWEWRPLYAITHDVSDSKSFTSGHSANAGEAAIALPLFLTLTKLGEKKHTVLVGIIIGFLYAFVIAFSRILALAHFMSDVSGGLLHSFIVGPIVFIIIFYIKKKAEARGFSL